MKITMIGLFLLTSLFANANPIGGYILNKKTKEKIVVTCTDEICADGKFMLFGSDKSLTEINPNLLLSLDSEGDGFYERYYIFNSIIITASTSRPPYPFTWFIFNMRSITKKLRRVFPLMVSGKEEDQEEFIALYNKNFAQVIKAIKTYQY